MNYSIIGSGAIGRALATHFASQGIEVLLANSRGPTSLTDIVRDLGPPVRAATVREASSADIVILAVPFSAVANAVGAIADWSGRIVVDATNAVDLPSFKPTNLGGRLSSEIVAEAVPGACRESVQHSAGGRIGQQSGPRRLMACDVRVFRRRRFVPQEGQPRPCHGSFARYANDPHWRDYVLFYEYFDGETGRGLGASHQTGWTALVASLLDYCGHTALPGSTA